MIVIDPYLSAELTNARRRRARVSGGGTAAIPAPFQSVNADGWSVTYASPVVSSPEEFTVSRQGYVGTTPTTISENLFCTTRVRQVYPNQASLTADRVALSDYIYSTDTIPLVTNNSAEASPKPVANWALPDRTVIGDTLVAEVVAFHRNARDLEQVAAVEFTATDGSNSVSQIVTTSVISGRANDQFPVIVYRCSLDVSGLSNPATITLNAKVYPHIGGASSVLDSASSSVAREFSPRTYLRNTSLATSPQYVYVTTSGNDTTGVVSTNPATAEATPCLTIAGAIARINTVVGDSSGAIIRLGSGTFTLNGSFPAKVQGAGELIITRDPNVSKANAICAFGTVAARMYLNASGGSALRFKDLTISRTGTSTIGGEAASQIQIVMEDCDFNNGGHNATMLANSHLYLVGTSVTNTALGLFNPATFEIRMLRGVTCPNVTSLEHWLILGCSFVGTAITPLRGTRTHSGAINAFSRFTGLSSTGSGFSFAGNESVTGVAFVQNIVEYISATGATAIRFSGDGATGGNIHAIVHHNTFAGFFLNGRGNLFYEDGATPRTSKLMSVRGNIHVQINTKGDVFVSNGTRVGNWAYLYGVGCEGEFSQFIDADSGGLGSAFAQAYPGLNASIGTSSSVRNDPLFVDYEGTTSGPTAGAGGGNYALQSGSPAKDRAKACIRFDAAGVERSLTTSAGAYQ